MKKIPALLALIFTLLPAGLRAGDGTFTVINTANDGAGSLRQAIADAAAAGGANDIVFAAAVSGQTIVLATELSIADAGGVTIDATGNAGGVTVSGNDLVRCFNINSTGNVTLRGLTITRGRAGDGGGVFVAETIGRLQMEQCTLHANVATNGSGGLRNAGTATVVNCTFNTNTANFGGAVVNLAAGNLTLRHCTVTGNIGTGCCGGVVARGTVTVESCLIAGNTGVAGPDINLETATFTRLGVNLIGNNTSLEAIFPAGLPNANGDFAGTGATLLPARLGPLVNNGGPSATMLPLPGSAARDRIAGTSVTTDQRGLPRGMWGQSDIGAAEAGVDANCAWEVREARRTPASALDTLALAEALAADAAASATSVSAPREVINFADPQAPGGGGFFNGDAPFVADTAADDDDFVTVARTFIRIPDAAPVRATSIRVTTLNPGGENNLSIAEIEVIQQNTGTNVALSTNGGTASGASEFGTVPGDANDGDTNGDHGAGSVWHSPGTAPGDAITVTFSAAANVESFRLWGRTDCCQERDDLLRVEFFDGATLVSSQVMGILGGSNATGSGRVRDYTFGFKSDDGARLRIFRADGAVPPLFSSSTRLNTGNPADPAHSGNTLSFPGLTGDSDTLGVIALAPGDYALEFLTWERNGGAHAEVFAATGAKTAVDGSYWLIGDEGSRPAGLGAPAASQIKDEPFTANNGAYTVTETNGPFAGPWTYNAAAGTWSTAGQQIELNRAPSTALTSPVLNITRAGETQVQFTHRHSFEDGRWDGGQLQMSVNGGLFTAIPSSAFTANGYNGTVLGGSASAIKGQLAFVETSAGYATPAFITSSASLGMLAAGDKVQLRFLAAFDTNTSPAPAWEITSVTVDQPGGWGVTVIRNGANSLAAAVNQMSLQWCGSPQTGASSSLAPVINFTDPQSGGGGHGQTQANFPGDTAADDDNFALGARTTITVPSSGDYTFCILGDDSVRLRIPGSRNWTVTGGATPVAIADGFQTNGCCADVFGQVFLNSGTYQVELIFNEIAGFSYVGLWAAPGRLSTFDAQTARYFTPVGTNVTGNSNAAIALATQAGAVVRPANDDFANAIPLTGATVSAFGCNENATLETSEPVTTDLQKSVWWNWAAPASGSVLVDTAGSNFDTILSVHTGATLTALTLVGNDDDNGPGSTSSFTFTATAGTVYRLRVGGYEGETGRIRLNVAPPVPPAPAPGNDNFAAATALTGTSVIATGDNTSATAQPGEPDHFVDEDDMDPATHSVWYTWTAPAAGDYIFDTDGSSFDTVLSIYTGTALNALTRLASDDDSGAGSRSRIVLTATASVTYRIAVDGYSSSARGRIVLNIVPVPTILAYSLRNNPANNGTRIFNLRWRSEPNVIYRVQSSPDLTTWAPVTTCTASEGTETDLDIEGIPATTTRLYFRVVRE